MIALEEDALVAAAAVDQKIDGLSRRRSAIDIVAQENMKTAHRCGVSDVVVDRGEHVLKEVRASVNIADCVDSNPVR